MSYDRKLFPWIHLADRMFGDSAVSSSAVSSSGHRHIASGVQRDSLTQVPCHTNLSKTLHLESWTMLILRLKFFAIRHATQFRYFVYTNSFKTFNPIKWWGRCVQYGCQNRLASQPAGVKNSSALCCIHIHCNGQQFTYLRSP
jgi:hypothetical protein